MHFGTDSSVSSRRTAAARPTSAAKDVATAADRVRQAGAVGWQGTAADRRLQALDEELARGGATSDSHLVAAVLQRDPAAFSTWLTADRLAGFDERVRGDDFQPAVVNAMAQALRSGLLGRDKVDAGFVEAIDDPALNEAFAQAEATVHSSDAIGPRAGKPEFTVPTTQAREGDTLADIAARSSLSEGVLQAANPDLPATTPLSAGQSVRLPPERLFAQWDWTPSRTGNTVDNAALYAAWNGTCPARLADNAGPGVIKGPDDRDYAVMVPEDRDPCPPGQQCVGAPNGIHDDGPDSGWFTVGTKSGDVKIGDPIDAADRVAFAIAGTAGVGRLFGAQSVGETQSDHVRLSPDGSARIEDGTEAPASSPRRVLAPPPGQIEVFPFGANPDRDPRQGGGLGQMAQEHQSRFELRRDRFRSLGIAIGAAEGLGNSKKAELNQSHAAQVVFQEHTDGRRRAVINLYQVQIPMKTGGEEVQPRLQPLHGVIDPKGELVLARRPDAKD